MNTRSTPFLSAAAVCLVLTSGLKLALFIRLPVVGAPADTVLPFVSQRELLLLASISEIVVATLITKVVGKWQSGLWLAYFCACATLYQVALLFVAEQQPCRCLGVADEWFGAKRASAVSRALLAFLWVCAFVECRRSPIARPQLACTTASSSTGLMVMSLLSATQLVKSDTVSLMGEYKIADMPIQNDDNTGARPSAVFHAQLDNDGLLLEYNSSSLYPSLDAATKYGIVLSGSRFYASSNVVAWLLNVSSPNIGAVYDSPERVWGLCNAGDGLATRVLVSLRSRELFPISSRVGRRLLAPSHILPGTPLSVATEAQYQWATNDGDLVLTYEVRVSDRLSSQWHTSPLLDSSLFAGNPEQEQASGQPLIDRYTNGFVLERGHFSKFTNVGTLSFPQLAEFRRYANTGTNGNLYKNAPTLKSLCVVSTKVETTRQESLEKLFQAVNFQSVTVTDKRLFNIKLRIGGVTYTTNRLDLREVAPMAIALFENECLQARQRDRMRRIRESIGAMLMVLICLAPAVVWLVRKTRNERE